MTDRCLVPARSPTHRRGAGAMKSSPDRRPLDARLFRLWRFYEDVPQWEAATSVRRSLKRLGAPAPSIDRFRSAGTVARRFLPGSRYCSRSSSQGSRRAASGTRIASRHSTQSGLLRTAREILLREELRDSFSSTLEGRQESSTAHLSRRIRTRNTAAPPLRSSPYE